MPTIDFPLNLRQLTANISASVAVFEYSKLTGYRILICNQRFLAMIGKESTIQDNPFGEGVKLPSYATSLFNEKLSKSIETAEALEFEQVFKLGNQSFWWRLSLKPIIKDNVVNQIMVTAIDITEKVMLEKALQISHSRFSSVIEAAYDGIVTIDKDQNIILFNSAAESMFDYNKAEVIGKPLTILMPEKHRGKHNSYVQLFANSPLSSRDMTERSLIYSRRKDGTEFPCEITISKIIVNSRPEFTAIIRDISERAKLLNELEHAAITDSLTGLYNRRYLEQEVAKSLITTARYNRSLSVLFLDLDDFKKINDQYGHDVGDEVLRVFSKTLLDSFRECDTVARFGGEEFICLLPETDINAAFDIADRCRKIVESLSISKPNHVKFTVSIGISTYEAGDNQDTLFHRCDQAVYAAKAAGKNNCKVYQEK